MASFRYDEPTREWVVDLPDHMGHRTPKVTVDTPCVAKPGRLEFAVSEVTRSEERTVLGRKVPLPKGYVNDPCMYDWKLRWDSDASMWVIWREDVPEAIARSGWVELDCHAESSEGGILNCRAEALVDSYTFRTGSNLMAEHIKLRTLVVYDQEVSMNVIAVSHSTVQQMGG